MTLRRFAAALPAIVVAVALALLLAIPSAGARGGETVGPIDTFDRQVVAASYQRNVADNFALTPSWTGSRAACTAGDASAVFDAATLETLNWFRRMAGLPPVAEDSTASATAQRAALMMDAAYALSHDPSAAWPCHTAAGAAAAGASNLTLGITGPRGILGQIEDPGAGNDVLGHRRWLLFPRLAEVGIGNTERASAIRVIGEFGPRPRDEDWIAWPPAGYAPAAVVYDRWSLSFNHSRPADFSRARVTMTENGNPVAVRLLPLVNGYGDATLGWEPVGITPDRGHDVLYEVTVSGIVIDGVSRTHRYDVVAFDSARALDEPSVVAGGERQCRGRRATIVGTDRGEVIRGTAGPDVIVALGGADVIYGGGGDDLICAGKGNDEVYGDAGNDTIIGGQGNDVLRGGAGRDHLNGQNGRDRLAGNQGDDRLVGGNHRDVIIGNTGTDSCWGTTATAGTGSMDDLRTCELGGA